MSAPITTSNPLQTPLQAPITDSLKFFLANVGFNQTAVEIKSYIEQYFGPVNYVKLIPYRENSNSATSATSASTAGEGGAGGTGQKHKGYGFLYMLTEEGASTLENYVNAFPGNKIRLVDREGVYVAKHDERRANNPANTTVSGNVGSTANGYTGYTLGQEAYPVADANAYAVQAQGVPYTPSAAASASASQPVAYAAQQPQQQGTYPNVPQQPTQQYAYPVGNQYAVVPSAQIDYSQQQQPGYATAPQQQQNGYIQQPQPQQMMQPAYQSIQVPPQQIQQQQQYIQPSQQQGPSPMYSQQHPQYNQQAGPSQPYNSQPAPLAMQGPSQPMYHQQMNYGSQTQNYSHHGPQRGGGRFDNQGGGKFTRGGRGRNNMGRNGDRNNYGMGRGPPHNMANNMGRGPLSHPSMMGPGPNYMGPNMGPMRGMSIPPPPRGGGGRGFRGGRDGRSFRGGGRGGRNQRDLRSHRPY